MDLTLETAAADLYASRFYAISSLPLLISVLIVAGSWLATKKKT